MPVGKYSTFGECVGAQIRKGYSRDVAQRICGKIEKESKRKQSVKGTLLNLKEHETIEEGAVNETRSSYGIN